MTFGFEGETFVTKKGQPEVDVRSLGLPYDDCGYLVEIRGAKAADPFAAAGLYMKELAKVTDLLKNKGLSILKSPSVELEPAFKNGMLRQYGKNAVPLEQGSMYGYQYAYDDKLSRAGFHVHIGNEFEKIVEGKDGKVITIRTNGFLDMPTIIQAFDSEFGEEIAAAQRLEGLYELKPYGFEYRSLPAHVDVWRVAKLLDEIL